MTSIPLIATTYGPYALVQDNNMQTFLENTIPDQELESMEVNFGKMLLEYQLTETPLIPFHFSALPNLLPS